MTIKGRVNWQTARKGWETGAWLHFDCRLHTWWSFTCWWMLKPFDFIFSVGPFNFYIRNWHGRGYRDQ